MVYGSLQLLFSKKICFKLWLAITDFIDKSYLFDLIFKRKDLFQYQRLIR